MDHRSIKSRPTWSIVYRVSGQPRNLLSKYQKKKKKKEEERKKKGNLRSTYLNLKKKRKKKKPFQGSGGCHCGGVPEHLVHTCTMSPGFNPHVGKGEGKGRV
jgi:hypothetical protein